MSETEVKYRPMIAGVCGRQLPARAAASAGAGTCRERDGRMLQDEPERDNRDDTERDGDE